MQKSKIEWCNHTINPIIGCKGGCSYCYAKKMNNRFKWVKKWEEPEVKYDWLAKLKSIKKPSRIFMGSVTDLFGEWVYQEWIEHIIKICGKHPQHTFLFLTKNPKRYAEFEFPDNCWLGATFIGEDYSSSYGMLDLGKIKNNNKFVSYEPMLKDYYCFDNIMVSGLRWMIIGGLTGAKAPHEKEWIDVLIKQCKRYKIPIFIKSNAKYPIKIQNYPEEMKR